MTNRIDGNLYVKGNLKADSFDPPLDSIGDQHMDAANPIDVDKQVHQYVHTFAQNRSGAAATERKALFSAFADGTIVSVQAGVTQAAVGDSTVTVDVYKNGVSVLSGTITLDNSNAAFTPEIGTLSSPGYSAGQVIEVVVTATAGTGTLPRGVYATVVVNEDQS